MRRLLGSLFMATGALVLAAGVIGVLVGVERLLSRREGTKPPSKKLLLLAAPQSKPQRHFGIRRTKSEVGYAYWILEGYGKYKCFLLCDTWQEAIEQARSRLQAVAEPVPELATSSS